jgi:hypothetical protein
MVNGHGYCATVQLTISRRTVRCLPSVVYIRDDGHFTKSISSDNTGQRPFLSIIMRAATFVLTLSALSSALAQSTVYLIRHGEKPSSGNGLNAQGQQRAQCLRNVFGANSGYEIGYIMAETPKSGRSSSSGSQSFCRLLTYPQMVPARVHMTQLSHWHKTSASPSTRAVTVTTRSA